MPTHMRRLQKWCLAVRAHEVLGEVREAGGDAPLALPQSMSTTVPTGDSPKPTPRVRTAAHTLGIRQAAFIGVGSMVGAGIFSLLGAAGAVAGAAVWISFLLAGVVAGLQGYSFAKFGAAIPQLAASSSTCGGAMATATCSVSRPGWYSPPMPW